MDDCVQEFQNRYGFFLRSWHIYGAYCRREPFYVFVQGTHIVQIKLTKDEGAAM